MWRLHFTSDDLARTRVAPTLGPLAETLFGLMTARSRWPVPAYLLGWRDRARARFNPAFKPLTDLAAPGSIGLDLWSLTGEAATIEQGLEALRALRPGTVRAELARTPAFAPATRRAWRLGDADAAAREEVAVAARAAYEALLEPVWEQVSGRLDAERTARAHDHRHGGTQRMLAGLPGVARWSAPVLYVDAVMDADVHLGGRGVTLVPSMFVGDMPLLLSDVDPDGPFRLIYPAHRDSLPLATAVLPEAAPHGVTQLIGHTRARVLLAIATAPCTTTELAGRTRTSLATASQHASVLRQAGLITTRRDGLAVRHVVTPLGQALLNHSA
ncbi:ArsR/SmtB family transcription factor [Hamadaea tsunoensis]|uniref:ArsR/SmtB family transcription factor n=1 Tax=Hamadaea tsunoensis TaxID=53368 RepID=UPI00041F0CC2|nr:winged helix-turn-helix domain-containing protein [Hamadaea tsunoensis]